MTDPKPIDHAGLLSKARELCACAGCQGLSSDAADRHCIVRTCAAAAVYTQLAACVRELERAPAAPADDTLDPEASRVFMEEILHPSPPTPDLVRIMREGRERAAPAAEAPTLEAVAARVQAESAASLPSLHESERKRREGSTPAAERERCAKVVQLADALAGEFERTIAHAEWRAAGSKGMSVPFHGDFASVVQLPSVVGQMRWWARELRAALAQTDDTAERPRARRGSGDGN